MSAKSKKSLHAPQRAGIPLARANRLREQTQILARRPAGGVLGLSTIAVIGLVAVGTLAPGGAPTAQAKEYIAVVRDVIPEPVRTAVLGEDKMQEVATAPSPRQVETQQVRPATAPRPTMAKPETAAVAEVRSGAPYCIRMIDPHLGALTSDVDGGAPWTELKDDLGRLVQNALDCPEAGVQIVGSLSLAATDIADMRLRWDRAENSLELATVARNGSERPNPQTNTQVIELVLR